MLAGELYRPEAEIGAEQAVTKEWLARAIIGAGSVVTRDVEPGQTVTGNPARPRHPRPVAED